MPAPTAAALRAKSDWAVAVEEAAEKGLAEEEVIEEGAKEGAVPKEARGGRDRWRLKERKDEEKKGDAAVFEFSSSFFPARKSALPPERTSRVRHTRRVL